MEEIHQENNVVVEILIVSHYKVFHGKLFYTVLELHHDQWNARHATLFGFDNHAFLFLSAFRRTAMRDERLS